MKCIILAADKGVRMMPLTAKTPKPLLKVKGKAIIDYVLESLPKEITEIIITVDYLGEQIKEHIGNEYQGRPVKYVQGSDQGNAYSFFATRVHLHDEEFLIIYGDEMPNKTNVKKCIAKKLSILTFVSPTLGLQDDGVMVLNTDIYNYFPMFSENELHFHDLVDMFVCDHDVNYVDAVDFVGEINTPEQFNKLNG
jgi:choline kinase